MLRFSRRFFCQAVDGPAVSAAAAAETIPAAHPLSKAIGGATSLLRNRSATNPIPIGEAINTDKTKYVMLYFSANWCPPCRQFTPILSKFYNQHKDKKGVEVIFCSWDQNEKDFSEYFNSHPEWLAVDRSVIDAIATQYNIQTIPSLMVLDAQTGELVTRKGRLGVAHDPTAKDFPWKGIQFTDHVNVNAPKNAMLIGGAATCGASLLLWMFAQDRSSSASSSSSSAAVANFRGAAAA